MGKCSILIKILKRHSRPFVTGFGSVLDISGSCYRRPRVIYRGSVEDALRRDAAAVEKSWRIVGDELRTAIHNYQREHPGVVEKLRTRYRR